MSKRIYSPLILLRAAVLALTGLLSGSLITAATAAEIDDMAAAYMQANWPALDASGNPQAAQAWVGAIDQLRLARPQADLARLAELNAAGEVSDEDLQLFRTFLANQLQVELPAFAIREVGKLDPLIVDARILAELVVDIAEDDDIRAFNFAGPTNGEMNQQRLDAGLMAARLRSAVAQVFSAPEAAQPENLELISAAHARFVTLKEQAARGEAQLAAMPAARPRARAKILPSLAQTFWMNGREIAQVDANGGIWIDSREVGNITDTGEIWVESSNKGSLEPDGSVWFEGREVGSLEDNGEVWVESRHVATFDDEGRIYSGTSSGSIEPFQGEWKRAAIVLFFGFFRN